MFERYTGSARRVIFLARDEAGRSGCGCIETHHLLLALLRENPALAASLPIPPEAAETIRRQFETESPQTGAVASHGDLPLSHEAKRVFAFAAEESARLSQRFIGPEHLVLGVLREETSSGARVLREHGLDLTAYRAEVERAGSSSIPAAAFSPEDMHRMLDELPEDRRKAAGCVLHFLSQESACITVSGESGAYKMTFGQPADQPESNARYSERARRALHAARCEASLCAAKAVETEHLLIGALSEDRVLALRLFGSPLEIEAIRKDIYARTPEVKVTRPAIDLPFSGRSRRVLLHSAGEAQTLGHEEIETADLVLGMLREPDCVAAGLLARRSITVESARQRLGQTA